MPKQKIGFKVKGKGGVVEAARDVGGLAVTGVVSQTFGLVGALIATFVSPRYIAGSEDGKKMNKYFGYLMIADKLTEMLLGGVGVV